MNNQIVAAQTILFFLMSICGFNSNHIKNIVQILNILRLFSL